MSQNENRVRNILYLIQNAERELHKAKGMLENFAKDAKNDYEDIPGVLGVYDGANMVCADGKTYEVNPNYAAKSMLVVGDNLKMIEEDGKQIFKQVSKVERKELHGVLNKKEGVWYALTDAGSYHLLDEAVAFRRGQLHDEVTVLIPEGAPNTEFAALEKLAKEEERPIIDEEKAARYREKMAKMGSHSSESHPSEKTFHKPTAVSKPISSSKPVRHSMAPSVGDRVEQRTPTISAAKKPASSRSTSTSERKPTSAKPTGKTFAASKPRSASPERKAEFNKAPRRAPRQEESQSVSNEPTAVDKVNSIVEEDDLV
jgi:hypothetical protein